MKKGYYGDVWIMYMAMLERTNGIPGETPNQVLKIGVTNAKDPMYRLMYNKEDEKHPISNYFDKITILMTRTFKTEEEALQNERRIMGMVKKRYKSEKFHNWLEEDKLPGITEMRWWKDNEAFYVKSIFGGQEAKYQCVYCRSFPHFHESGEYMGSTKTMKSSPNLFNTYEEAQKYGEKQDEYCTEFAILPTNEYRKDYEGMELGWFKNRKSALVLSK